MSEQASAPAIKREFITERQGREFVLYAGLLDLAHRQGLKRIQTRLLQIPGEENGHVAICFAEVEIERGVFTGIGDASPENVSRPMLHHIIRLAETRAKARALRDAVNIGTAAVEELGDEDVDAHPNAPVRQAANGAHAEPRPPAPRPAPARPSGPPPAARQQGTEMATPAQVRAAYLIGRDQHGLSETDLDARSVALYGAAPAELTKRQASDLITSLKAQS